MTKHHRADKRHRRRVIMLERFRGRVELRDDSEGSHHLRRNSYLFLTRANWEGA